MDYLELSRLFTIVASIVITLGLYRQIVKIWKTKSAKDFSLLLIVALFINEIAWLNYGLALGEWPIIFIGVINIPAIVMAFYGFLKYGIKKDI
ncbi:MAG: MtN3/saliva family protein [bacterium ADurb.Bin212]|nr:MAG: MtN3/saliva family protein [bacterium ADurb.Bin212]